MRLYALVGFGLPVLVVSGAVAYGSIQEISKSFVPVPSPQSDKSILPVAKNAADFLTEGRATWDVPQEEALVVPSFSDQPLGLVVHSTVEQPEDVMPPRESLENTQIFASAPLPKQSAGPLSRESTSVVKMTPETTAQGLVKKADKKRDFKMPWQTGIFQ